MQNLLLEVKSVRRCEGGHTCNLNVNGKKVAFIGPGIFEWTSHPRRIDVLTWYATKEGLKVAELQPVELKEGWESQVPDHKFDDARHDATEASLHEWIKLHFVAFELLQRCRYVLMTLGNKGEILDWGIPPGNASESLKRVAAGRPSLRLLNGLSMPELVRLLEEKKKSGKSATPAKA
ncbi:hypothetical protein UFOVP431_35 [uncultured Caudovirales phage]|uniref:Uncharacterized protein n=1 Tax=uncultured Caudovirales phage TaxID=2100421 RepID=A0A6J5MQE7_9CAUD|nr:hypothetical protein UFOVP431_35 [uncultured Caudovirales phage]